MKYTEQQQAAIISDAPRICVDAGAGSGKTRVLVDRIAHLLVEDRLQLDQVVAITFTDKAAGEMKQRLRMNFRDKARAAIDSPKDLSRWRDLERQVEHTRISTIHSFCTGILRENALRLGMRPDFAVLTDADAVLLKQEVVGDTLHTLLEEQDDSFYHAATTYSTDRVERLMQQLLSRRGLLHRIAAQPQWEGFSNPEALQWAWTRAGEEEQKRCLLELPQHPEVLHFLERLEAFSGKCFSHEDGREIQRLGLCEHLDALRSAKTPTLIKRALSGIVEMERPQGKTKNWDCEKTYKSLSELQKKIMDWAKGWLTPKAPDAVNELACARMTCAIYQIFRRVDAAFAEEKARAGSYDFDDLIELCVRALEENEEIRQRVAQSIRYLLVDEFQDTDGVQAQMVRMLADHPDGPSVFVVGDAKQSIYYFRGAEVEVFSEAREASAEVIRLDENFRSLPDVLEFVNDFFGRTRLLESCGAYPPMQVHRKALGRPRVEFLLDVQPEDGPPLNAEAYRRQEAAGIAARIQEFCQGPDALQVCDQDAARPAAYGDIALLFRALENIYLYEEALRTAGVPYVLVQGRGFYQVQEVLDVLNFLKVVVDAQDGLALLAFLRGPFACLSDDALYWLGKAHSGGLLPAFNTGAAGKLENDRLETARALVDGARERLEWPLPSLLQWLLDTTAFEAVLLTQFHGVQKVSNVRKLIEQAANFSKRRPPSLYAFVQYLEQVRGEGVREGEAGVHPGAAGAVTIMSIHQSKGLEFPVVFIPDMGREQGKSRAGDILLHRQLGMVVRGITEDGETCDSAMFDAIKRRKNLEEQDESARLLYVAMTRARDYLVLCGNCSGSGKSWMSSLNFAHQLQSAAEGSRRAGAGWEAQVTRRVFVRPGVEAVAGTAPAPELREYIPLVGSVPEPLRLHWPISRLLNAMTQAPEDPEEAAHEEFRAGDEDAGAGSMTLVRGTAVHRLLELWNFADDSPPDIEGVLDGLRLGGEQRERMRETLSAFVGSFPRHPGFAMLAGARQAEREIPFLWRLDNHFVSGVIDAMLDGDTLVDYKTGSGRREQLQRYELQLQLYALAARALLGTTPGRGLLLFVDTNKMHEVVFTQTSLDATEARLHEALNDSKAQTTLASTGDTLPVA